MRTSVLTGLVACTLIIGLGGATASAEEQSSSIQTTNGKIIALLSTESPTALTVFEDAVVDEPQSDAINQPSIVTHVVVEGDTLSTIAMSYQTSWERLYDKNPQIIDPNIINVGDQIIVPTAEEQLVHREAPKPVVTETKLKNTVSRSVAPVQRTVARGSSSGNGYVAGYCTWYVKNRRPDLPNNLGNASTWVARAAAQGIPTGLSPQVGAVGQRGNHVVYVESVNADGTVTISEMNHKGRYIMTTRTLPANYFSYIY